MTNSVVETLNSWGEAWAGMLWSVVWQSTLLAGVIGAISFALRRSSPSVRYWLWQIVAIKLLVMPLWSVSIALPNFFHREVATAPVTPDPVGPGILNGITLNRRQEIPASGAAPDLSQPKSWLVREWLSQLHWQSWLFVAWLAGVVWQLASVLRHRIRLSHLLGQRSEVTDALVAKMVAELASRIGLGRLPRVVAVELDGSPFVCGMWQSVLVLPRGIVTGLDAAQLEQVLLHELAHLKRRDLLWGWIPQVARMLYFFHPVAHWVSYRIRLERELACDQVAMAMSGLDAMGYANTLVRVVSQLSQPLFLKTPAGVSVGLNGDDLSNEAKNSNKESSK